MSSNQKYLIEKCLYRLKSLVNEASRVLTCLDKCSLQKVLLAGLRVRDLVNHQANSALGNYIRHAVSQLDRYHCLGRREAEHWEQVHNWVCAPADHSHNLGCANFGCDNWVSFAGGSGRKADKQLVDDVQEESHGGKPAHPSWGQVTCDNELSVVSRHDHKSRTEAQRPCSRAEITSIQLHDQKNLDQKQWHREQPIHVAVRIVEWHACQFRTLSLRNTLVRVCVHPRVENSDVMVGSNERHKTGNVHCALVLVMNSACVLSPCVLSPC